MRFLLRSMRRSAAVAVLITITAGSVMAANGVTEADSTNQQLEVMASDPSMVWNAVVVDRNRILVAGPRWTGSKGPSLGIVEADGVRPFPNADWNAWTPGSNASRAFVNVNAIHRDREGTLWVIDTGSPEFGGNPLPSGAKLVRIDLKTNRVMRVYPLGSDIAQAESYVDDIRTDGRYGYLTDAGRPSLIVLDIETGALRRVLDHDPSTVAPTDRPIVLSEHIIRQTDGSPLRVNADPLELSPDGQWLYYGTLHGPWSKIETRYLNDMALGADQLAAHVEPYADLPPVGGTTMGSDGSLYFTELATNAVKRRTPNGEIELLAMDPRLHWVDAPFLDADQMLWLPVPQMDRSALFQDADHGRSWPM